jgi:predicted secreted protein
MLSQRRWLGLPVVLILMTACDARHAPTSARRSAVATAVRAPATEAVAIRHSDCPGAQDSRKGRAATARFGASEASLGLDRIAAFGATAEPDAAAPLCLKVGQVLPIHLPASHASGYGWVLESGLPPFLRMETDPGLETATPAAARMGAGIVDTWSFRAVHRGRGPLLFTYRRPWESTSAVRAHRVAFDVIAY